MTLSPGTEANDPSPDRARRIESLCHAALARPAGERGAFLAEACGDDAALRAEVESLIAGAESAPSFLESPVAAVSSPSSLIGRQLGAYRIDSVLGAGGMGEVYRAKDTRLGRDVAVKILPAAFTSDPQRRSRFEREARAIAALNHPNICTIHDVGHDQGVDFLVMELVDGESLATRLARGPLSLDEALARAIEIADALDKAHGQGIIHRDLKPGNVMLARSGAGKSRATQAKLLDFGLARIMPYSLAAAAAIPADTVAKTETGAMLGTLKYMAPEQIEGRPADARTDIFAFGALLYEMLTGRRAVEGASTAAVMAAILREDPPPVHPPGVGRVVRRCLAKDPIRRYQSARDLLNDLEEAHQSVDAGRLEFSDRPPLPAGRRVSGRSVRWLAIGLLGAATAMAGYLLRPPTTPPSYRPLAFQRGVITGAAFSPDGQTAYYSAAWGVDPPRVYMTGLEDTGSVRLDHLPPATLLSVSSKGELGLLLSEGRNPQVSSGTLARASALGGTPRPLLDGITDADWSPDGQQLAVLRNDDLELPPGHVLVPDIAIWPRISPGGDRAAYIAEDGVHVVDLEGRSVLDHKFPWTFGLAWRPDGREIWFTGDVGGSGGDRILYAVSLSGKRRVVATAPGAMTIYDIAKEGTRALVATGAGWWGVQAGRADRSVESTLDLFGRS
ncbi:MAG TPA: protein kinase, partial [Vicinamibacterales bacterium]|nr:protein kinase [Vicinamibacterales bacterium]